jgi:hypothetical protein
VTHSDPPPDPPPAAVCAPLEAEPLPPAGVDLDRLNAVIMAAFGPDLGAQLQQWREADWPAWARRGWRRLEKGQAKCPAGKAASAPN